MSIRSYFTVKKRDASEDELESVIPTSMAESVKAELQRTGGVKRSIDEEGGATEKKRLPLNKAKITQYAAKNEVAASIRHFNKQQAFSNRAVAIRRCAHA